MKHVILAFIKFLPALFLAYFTWINKFVKKKKEIDIATRYKKVATLLSKGVDALKMDIIVEGKENIPEETCCFFANHLGAADPLAFFKIIDRPTGFLGKIEIKKVPIVGKLLEIGGGEFLVRDDLRQQLKVMMGVQKNLENKELNYFIFPEGTRNKDDLALMKEFHHGTFRPATKAKVPLVPVAIYGSENCLGKVNYKKYPVLIKFLSPIYLDEYQNLSTQEVAALVQSKIQKEISFNLRKKYHQIMVESKDKNYRFNH